MVVGTAYANISLLLEPLYESIDVFETVKTAMTSADPIEFETAQYELVQDDDVGYPVLQPIADDVIDTISFIPIGVKRLGLHGEILAMEGFIVDSSDIGFTIRECGSNAMLPNLQFDDECYAGIIYDPVVGIAVLEFFVAGGYRVELQSVDSLYPQLTRSVPKFPEQLRTPCRSCAGCDGYEEGLACGNVECEGCDRGALESEDDTCEEDCEEDCEDEDSDEDASDDVGETDKETEDGDTEDENTAREDG